MNYMTSTLMNYVFQWQLPNCRAQAVTMYFALVTSSQDKD